MTRADSFKFDGKVPLGTNVKAKTWSFKDELNNANFSVAVAEVAEFRNCEVARWTFTLVHKRAGYIIL